MEKHSLKTIAAKLVISVATVSKALNDYKDISDTTKKKGERPGRRIKFCS